MWSDDLDDIIVAGDGDDRDGLGGQGDTSEDLSTRHCEEKLFLTISCGLESRQKTLCLISCRTHRLPGENWFHTVQSHTVPPAGVARAPERGRRRGG